MSYSISDLGYYSKYRVIEKFLSNSTLAPHARIVKEHEVSFCYFNLNLLLIKRKLGFKTNRVLFPNLNWE